MKPSFQHSIDVLVKAYLNDTLEHSNCCACAVGNLVADGQGIKIIENKKFDTKLDWERDSKNISMYRGWPTVFITYFKKRSIHPLNYHSIAKEQIDSTGYTWQQLAKIEFAFETADKGSCDDDWMFNGLMAVVNVLAEIHGVDLETKENAKLMFVKP